MARITQNAAARTARAVLLFAGCLALGVLCGLSSTSEGNLRQQRVSNQQEQSRQQQQKQEPSHMPDADLLSGAGRPVAGRNLDEDGADYVWEGDFAASQFASVLQEEASAPAHIEGLNVPDQALAGAIDDMSLSFDFKDDLSFSFSYDF